MSLDPGVEAQSLSRACNEALILAALRESPMHGYQLALHIEETSHGAFRFRHGTLYPILHRLEKAGLIQGTWSDEFGPGKRRKRYTITAGGRRYAERQRASWEDFIASFRAALELAR